MTMRVLMLTAILTALAGPVLAQGTFSPGGSSSAMKPASPSRASTPDYGTLPPPYRSATPARTAGYGAGGVSTPVQPGDAYRPRTYGSGSVYRQPQAPSRQRGAKPCETSVYVNACDR